MIYQTGPVGPLGCSEKPAQAHQVATVHLELTEGPRQVNDFSRKAYLHVKISVLVHTVRSHHSETTKAVFSRLGFVQVSALLFLCQPCKDM